MVQIVFLKASLIKLWGAFSFTRKGGCISITILVLIHITTIVLIRGFMLKLALFLFLGNFGRV